jgi:glutathione S-transferase
MKLFFSPGACSFAPHIILNELELDFQTEFVNLKTKVCASGNFQSINKKGSVPALMLDNGEVLTEVAVILQYLADLQPERLLFPQVDMFERYRALEWLNFVATELHKGFTPLFAMDRLLQTDAAKAELRASTIANLNKKFDIVEDQINAKYFLGEDFTIVDAYLFTVLTWSKFAGVDISNRPIILDYLIRVGERQSVIKAQEAEKLKK